MSCADATALDTIYDIEQRIIGRLRDKMPSEVQVLAADDLVDVQEKSQPAPAVHVIYDGYTVGDVQAVSALTYHAWLVVAVVRHAGSSVKAAAENKLRAGPLVLSVIDALLGFRPDTRPGIGRLRLERPPKPVARVPFYYYPSLFTAAVPVISRSNANG